MTERRGSVAVRAARDALVEDATLRGTDFGAALSDVIDRALVEQLDPAADVAVLALGSYARRELCPGSDVDVLLLHGGRGTDVGAVADALWYPLWDAGFVLGHATRTAKECRKLADGDLDTLTSVLDARIVAGRRTDEAQRLVADIRKLARRRRDALVGELADAATVRRFRPGPIAEMLAPNLKTGAGGLRDVQALGWAGWCVSEVGGWLGLVERGVLSDSDAEFLARARDALLEIRVELHRCVGGRSDLLSLEDQDSVAARLGDVDADALIRDLAATARRVAWIADEAWSALRPVRPRHHAPDTDLGHGVLRRADRITVDPEGLDAGTLLRVAAAAAGHATPIERSALTRLRDAPAPTWTEESRADLIAWLGAGLPTLDVFSALDHENLVSRILPEWSHVRFRPQRNAYHRFTVDRHLVETVIEAAGLLADPGGPSARPAAALDRPDLLLLGALFHDLAKGMPGDHATAGETRARAIAARLGYPSTDVDLLGWLVRDHLLMADTATRRDLADPVTVERFAGRVRTPERLALLTLLTVADSRATGPAAWGAGKAALMQELYERTVEHFAGVRPADETPGPPAEFAPLGGEGVVVEWTDLGDGRWRCSVGAPDRPGLLADVAGALSLVGFDIDHAEGHSLPDQRAAEVFDGTDRFDRLAQEPGRNRAAATVRGVLAGEISVEAGLHERRVAYGQGRREGADRIQVRFAFDESAESTVVEVYAPDEIGLLATVAGVFGALGLDVTVAKVATTGELAVDVFYVRDGEVKLTDPARIQELREALLRALRAD